MNDIDQNRIRPLADKVLIRKADYESRRPSGLLLPDIAQVHPQKGTVLAVGPGKSLDNGGFAPSAVKQGDVVLFRALAGDVVGGKDDSLVIMREDEILGIEG